MINRIEHSNDCNEGECKHAIKYTRLCPKFEGSNTTQAINHSVELAQLAESLGFIDFGLLNITKYCQLLLVLQK